MILGALESTQWVLSSDVIITCVARHAITWRYVKSWIVPHKITFPQPNWQKYNICQMQKLHHVEHVSFSSKSKFDLERSKGKVTKVKKRKIFQSLITWKLLHRILSNLVCNILDISTIHWSNKIKSEFGRFWAILVEIWTEITFIWLSVCVSENTFITIPAFTYESNLTKHKNCIASVPGQRWWVLVRSRSKVKVKVTK